MKAWANTLVRVALSGAASAFLFTGCASSDEGNDPGVQADAVAAPTNLSAENQLEDVALTWADNSSNETAFVVQRKTAENAFEDVATLAANVVRWVDENVTANITYTYRVAALKGQRRSAYSNTMAILVRPYQWNPPAAPVNVTATGETDTIIAVRWTRGSLDGTQFQLARSSLATGPFEVVGTASGTTLIFRDRNLEPSTTYYYRVAASNPAGSSPWSTVASGATKGSEGGFPPAVPSNLLLRVLSESSIEVSFKPEDATVVHHVERLNAAGAFVTIGVVPAGQKTLSDLGLNANQEYTYRVRARNAVGFSSPLGPKSIKPFAIPSGPPLAPIQVSAEDKSLTAAEVSFTDRTGNNARTQVWVITNGGAPELLTTLERGVTTYLLENLVQTSVYTLYLIAITDAGSSPESDRLRICTMPIPATPTGLAGQAPTHAKVTLTWNDVATNEAGYYVERKGSNGLFQQIGQTAANVATYEDTTMAKGVAVEYQVRAFNAGGNSAYSVPTSVNVPPAPPEAPTNVRGVVASDEQIQVDWNGSANATEYRVYMCAGTGCDQLVLAATVNGNTLTRIFSDLAPGTAHSFEVRAFNGPSGSPPSSRLTLTTLGSAPLGAPANFRLTAPLGFTTASLAWRNTYVPAPNEPTISLKNVVYRWSLATGWVKVSTLPFETTSVEQANLKNDSDYRWRVRVEISQRFLAFSREIVAHTPLEPPGAPTGFQRKSATANSLTLQWTKATGVLGGYQLKQRLLVPNAPWSAPVNLAATALTYTAANLQAGGTYEFELRAYNGNAVSGGTPAVGGFSTAATVTAPVLPQSPTNLLITDRTTGGATLNWTNNATNASSYEVEQSVNLGAFTLVGTLPATATSYVVSGLEPTKSYRFQIWAKNASGRSPASLVTALAPLPAAPSIDPNRLASTITAATFWVKDMSSNETGFRIERAVGTSTTFTAVAGLSFPARAGTGTSFSVTVSGLGEFTGYQFRAVATGATGDSAASNAVQITTQPNPPAKPQVVSIGYVNSADPPYVNAPTVPVRVEWAAAATGRPATEWEVRVSRPGVAVVKYPAAASATSLVFNLPSAPVLSPLTNSVWSVQIFGKNGGGFGTGSDVLRTIPRRPEPDAPSKSMLRIVRNGNGSTSLVLSSEHRTTATRGRAYQQLGVAAETLEAQAAGTEITVNYLTFPVAPVFLRPASVSADGRETAHGAPVGLDVIE